MQDLSFADTLSSCSKLWSLSLLRNPIERIAFPKYVEIIAFLIPSLTRLDGEVIEAETFGEANKRPLVTNGMILEFAYAMKAHQVTSTIIEVLTFNLPY